MRTKWLHNKGETELNGHIVYCRLKSMIAIAVEKPNTYARNT